MSDQTHDQSLLQQLCVIAAEQVGLDPSAVAPDSDFFTDLNFDSLDAVEFTMHLEDAFNVSIPDEVAQGVRTPRQAFELLRSGAAPG